MASAIVLEKTVTNPNDSKVRLVYDGATVGTKTITVPEVTARMLTDNTAAYDNDTSAFIVNTLTSGAIIERGSNANGEYVKFADGTMICKHVSSVAVSTTTFGIGFTFPAEFINTTSLKINSSLLDAIGTRAYAIYGHRSRTTISFQSVATTVDGTAGSGTGTIEYIAIGRWK